ncbi:hypothetical protein EUGRSUZ_J01732 [Eucalyptus grandis]|uniref:Uncharacterized protein n=2 Tax=Eucalyptus grandis TaxID=71139 RepID=A0A059AFZ3_EUCGR|nr:hypothetical protein EUGRSUZ_J01732 [Eucalyptus grandis]
MPSNEQWDGTSIYKVPRYIRILCAKAYRPQVVSFGPYHYKDKRLSPMKEHKRRALAQFEKRSGQPLKNLIESLGRVKQKLKDSYNKLDSVWQEEDKFLELMITDGCFMLEIMRTKIEGNPTPNHAQNEPIFSTHWLRYIRPYIRRDMLLLENQLPMLVLYELVAIESDYTMCVGNYITENAQDEETEKIIRSANELSKTGIQFEKSPTHSLKDISFAGGVLKLPVIKVDDTTESKFLNLITFERLHGTGNEIRSYIGFMDSIINNKQDVALLHTKGIIQNAIGSDEAVAELFNVLCQEVPVEFNESICKVQAGISAYYKDPSNSCWANFHDTYCSSPWARLSLCAATFLFALTIIQTIYTVLSYY